MISYDLLRDLNGLYCETKNKRVEDLFIKLAETSKASLFQWLSDNQSNKSLLSQMRNKKVLHSLVYLAGLDGKIANKDLGSYFFGESRNTNYMSLYSTFYQLIGSTQRGILEPFSGALQAFSGMTPNPGWDSAESVLEDLKKIDHAYDSYLKGSVNKPFTDDMSTGRKARRPNKREKLQRMFGFLLREFTKDVLAVLPPDSPLAKEVAAQKLYDPMTIVPLLHGTVSSKTLYPVHKLVTDAEKRISSLSFNNKISVDKHMVSIFNEMRNAVMVSINLMTETEFSNYKSENEDLSPFFEEDDDEDFAVHNLTEDQQPYPFNKEFVKHRDYIYVVTAILQKLHQKIK